MLRFSICTSLPFHFVTLFIKKFGKRGACVKSGPDFGQDFGCRRFNFDKGHEARNLGENRMKSFMQGDSVLVNIEAIHAVLWQLSKTR